MRIRFFLIVLLCCCVCAGAREKDSGREPPGQRNRRESMREVRRSAFACKGFIGGMMIHSGYVFSKDVTFIVPETQEPYPLRVQGTPAGIGGAIKLMFGEHLRIGSEGYVSNLTYGKYKSHATMGWGGLLAEAVWKTGKWGFFAGGLAGGGSFRNVTLREPAGDDFIMEDRSVSYRKYGFAAVAPYVGAEYAVSKKIGLVFKIDYVINVVKRPDDFVSGPKLFVGFMFGHSRLPSRHDANPL